MIIYMTAFTEKGRHTGEYLCEALETLNDSIHIPASVGKFVFHWRDTESLHDFVAAAFRYHLPVIFIGAAGIAVRAIHSFIEDKTTDSPVLVLDDAGQFVIPILSGHLGGANDLASLVAGVLGATPVITTASDVHHCFSPDVFARRNGLVIHSREGARLAADRALAGKTIVIGIDPGIRIPAEHLKNLPAGLSVVRTNRMEGQNADVIVSRRKPSDGSCLLWLSPKTIVTGIGCRRGRSFEELNAFFLEKAERMREKMSVGGEVSGPEDFIRFQLRAIATIDRKADEEGLQLLAQYWHLPLLVYSAEELEQVPGDFAESGFVREVTGVSNVCERAAVLGAQGKLIVRKQASAGMTFAAAEGEPVIRTFHTEVLKPVPE